MTIYSGLGGLLVINSVNVAKIKNWTFTTTTNHPDASAKADSYAVAVKGRTSGSWTADCLWDSAGPTPTVADVVATTVYTGIFSSGPSGSQKITCDVWINEYETESPDEDPVAVRLSGISDDTITFGLVT